MSEPSAPEYQRRLIMFVDFLGFKEIVEGTVDNSKMLARLILAMNEVGDIGTSLGLKSQRVTQFSDSMVISFQEHEQSGVFWLLSQMAIGVVRLASLGFLVRGAVTVGNLYHDNRHVVGPAMVRAYEMESKEAKFPRVLIDPSVIELGRARRDPMHSAKEEEKYVRKFVTKDSDGRLFFDYVSWNSVVNICGLGDDDYPDYLNRLRRLIKKGLRHESVSVQEKYVWLHRQYVSVKKQFAQLPPDHPYRGQSPGNCAAVDGLRHHSKLASRAKARIKREHKRIKALQAKCGAK